MHTLFPRPTLALRSSAPRTTARIAATLLGFIGLALAGCGGGGSSPKQAATPTFSPAGGSFAATQSVTLADSTTGATVYYTTDGSTPTASSTPYTAAISVAVTETINAVAVASGYDNSAVATATYTITGPPAAAPTFSPAAGSFTAAQSVTLADTTSGATIYYTLDGSTPTSSSTKYTAAISVGSTTTINAVAVATGFSTSPVATATYTINLPAAATPTFSPAAGTFTAPQSVTLTDGTAGSTIYYTLDGSTPTASSTKYTGAISVSTTTTINAIATAAGFSNSGVASGTFTINLPPAATPTFTPAAGTFAAAQSVTIVDTTIGATIYYTLDGSTPTTASAKYSGTVTVNTTTTIKAIATATNYTNSAIASGTFTINLPAAATPTFSPAAGTFSTTQTVSLADSTSGATIYYTLDGSTPTTSSAKYTAPISVATTTTIKAVATATNFTTSAVASGTFTINIPPAATPTFSPAAGTFTSDQTITISDTTPGATIYYTTDGSTPATTSTKYTAPIAVDATTTIKAIAAATGDNNSAVATATFTINLPAAATPTFTPVAGTYATTQSVTIADATSGATIYYTTDGSAPTTSSTKYTTAISVATTTTINAIATASGYTTSSVGTATYTIASPTTTVSIALTTHDQTKLLATQTPVAFKTGAATANQIVVDETQQFQPIEGFGASFTDGANYLLADVVPPASLPATMSDLFTRTGNGIGLSFMRLPMGSTDLARTVYTYDDNAGAADPNLTNFSIAHDNAYIIPIIQQAKTLNPSMKIMANPWSPPGWMKGTNPSNVNGSTFGGSLLGSSVYKPFANYFVKFIQAYAAANIPIDYISLQNEPLNNTAAYPSMYMLDPEETTVMRDYVLPAFQTAKITSKFFAYDHNWDNQTYPENVLADPTLDNSDQVAGVAWHGYGGLPGAQSTVQAYFPNKGTWETEHSGGTFITDQFTNDFTEITDVIRNWGRSYVKWGLALDQNRGPNLTEAGYGGCNTCSPIVQVQNPGGTVTKTIEYYTLGQYSKYVLPGAVRIYSSDTATVSSVGFLNTDGSKALVVYNKATTTQPIQIQWGTQTLSYTMPASAAATFTWNGTQSGNFTISAKSQIQASGYVTESGIQDEDTGDATGIYDIGYVNNNATLTYNNIDFGTGVSTVNVRTASGGNGGTLEFHLDSATGTLLGTATLPVTGGYQTWKTVSTSVSGATGVHTLYLVFKGSGGIANLNWFQFQ